jgi:DNA-binding NtrC family response regulator
MRKLQDHDWRGNIREFRNVVERAVLFAGDEELGPELIHFDAGTSASTEALKKPRLRAERLSLTPPGYVREILKKHKGSVAATVRELGTTAGALYYYLKQHGIDPVSYRMGLHDKNEA